MRVRACELACVRACWCPRARENCAFGCSSHNARRVDVDVEDASVDVGVGTSVHVSVHM